MRKLNFVADINGTTNISFSLAPSPSPSPSPAKTVEWLKVPTIPIYDNPFDIAAIVLIMGLLFLSLLSLSLILHLRVKSRQAHHLHKFNSLWSVRLVFIFFISLWAINEMPKLPLLRHKNLFPFCPSLTLTQQVNICKLHVVLSLGLFEPGFLLTLLYLLNLSTDEGNNTKNLCQIPSIFVKILPVFLFQTICVLLPPLKMQMPVIMSRSGMLVDDVFGNKAVICAYPLFSCIIFAAFVISYLLGFILSCWRVMSLVINKGIKDRINVLTFTIMVTLPIQILLLGVLAVSTTETTLYGGSLLAVLLSVAICAAVGEVILVIKPIADALSAVGDSCMDPVQSCVNPVQQ